jgi:subtilase family serine protease
VKVGTSASGNPLFKFGVQDPSTYQWITGVGGTTLTPNADSTWFSETAWTGHGRATGGGGGGTSNVATLPSYQSLYLNPGANSSATARNVPDVSLNSSTGYSIYFFGTWFGGVGGTSCAAPLWAGFTARVNQRRAAHAIGSLGFANPTLYELARSSRGALDFHDIVQGNIGAYPAVAGYDNATGIGSFDGGNLIGDLLANATVFWVDGSYAGSTPLGTPSNPYKYITDAVNAAPLNSPSLVYIRGGTYLETPTINKPIVMVNNGGGIVSIGH